MAAEAPGTSEYAALLDIPDLGVSKTGVMIRDASFLVVPRGSKLVFRKVAQRRGGNRYLLDQDENPSSVVLRPGGLYRNEALVAGDLSTVSEHRDAVKLYESFSGAFRRFKKVGNYRIGPEAAALLASGWRLVTMGIDEPPGYDLKA
jgi:hypothetical protein